MSNFRGAPYLRAAIASVLAQSHANLELIVADDASDDGSLEILTAAAEADARVVVIALTTNRGPGGARNAALDVARGDWIALIDSDDLVHPRRIERLLKAAVVTGADMIADNPVQFGTPALAGSPLLDQEITGTWRIGPADLIGSDTASSGTSSLGYLKPIIRRDLLAEIRYDEGLRIGEDFDLYFRLLLGGAEFHVLPDPTYLYRRHAGSVSHRLSVDALSSLLVAQGRAESLADRRDAADRSLTAAFRRRRALLMQALRYEELVAAIKARKLVEAGWRIVRHPSLLVDLRNSLSDRARRRRATELSAGGDGAAGGTLALAAQDRIGRVAAPDGAERIGVAPMRDPAASTGADHRALACRLAQFDPARLDVIADGVEAVHAIGYLSGWRSALIRLPRHAVGCVALPAGATLEVAGD
jgi:succinoglycan biosynthesis protein ExoO